MVLVGDTLAEVVLGHETTLPLSFETMLHHTSAARRAIKRALLVADLPYGSYHASEEDAVRFAVRFLKEGGAQAVKLEGGRKRVDLIRRMIDAEIPMMGHIGLTPQSVHRMGGYKVQGRTAADIEKLVEDALALDNAGVFAMVLEGIPREVARIISEEVSAPTLGIGAGPDCDGQVLVLNDLLGLTYRAGFRGNGNRSSLALPRWPTPRSNPLQRTIGRLTQVLRASSIVTTGRKNILTLRQMLHSHNVEIRLHFSLYPQRCRRMLG